MEIYKIIMVFVAIVVLATLFVISTSLSSISRNLRIIRKTLIDWKKESGTGTVFTCNNCHNKYEGKQPFCPHCGAAIPHQ